MNEVQSILKRYEVANSKRSSADALHRDAMEYYAPHRNTWSEAGEHKSNGSGKLFDSVPQKAYEDYASVMHSVVTPPGKKFSKFVPGMAVPEKQKKQFAEGLEIITDAVFKYLGLSNFDMVIGEAYLDFAISGGAFSVHKGTREEPFHFSAIPLSELILERGPYGKIGARFRKHKIPVQSIEDMWGEDVTLPKVLEELKQKDPTEEVELIEVSIPQKVEKTFTSSDGEQGKKVNKTKVDGSRYMLIYKGEKEQEQLVDREYPWQSIIVFRNRVNAGQVYGYGPCLVALAEVKTLNKTKELILKNASLSMAGSYTVVDDGVLNINTLQVRPGSLIPVSSNAGGINGPTIAPLPRSGDFDVGQFILKDLQGVIREIFFNEPLGPVDAPVKSATEISYRQQAFAQKSGAVFGRVNYELIRDLMRALLMILDDLDLINLEDLQIDGALVDIQHVSPIAMAQDQEDLTALLRLLEVVGQTYGQEALGMVMPLKKVLPELTELMGVSQKIPASKAEIEALEEQVKKQALNQQQMQQGA